MTEDELEDLEVTPGCADGVTGGRAKKKQEPRKQEG